MINVARGYSSTESCLKFLSDLSVIFFSFIFVISSLLFNGDC